MANVIRRRGDMLGEDRREVPPARKKMIHDHRSYADSHGPSLPYEIGIFKPKLGNKRRDVLFECECGHKTYITCITCGIVCKGCNTFKTVK